MTAFAYHSFERHGRPLAGKGVRDLLIPGDVASLEREGFRLRARVEADEGIDEGDAREGLVGVVVEVVEHVEIDYRPASAYVYEHDVVLADASLWGIDSLEGGYAEEVVTDLAKEAIEHARGVLARLRVRGLAEGAKAADEARKERAS